MGRRLASVVLAAALAVSAHAQSRLERLEAAGASSALDRFEFGRAKVKPRPPAPPPPRAVRPPPPPEDDPERERPRKVAARKPAPKIIAEPRPDAWLSHAGSGGWGPLVLD